MSRALSPCAEPGCPTLTDQTRCPRHHKAKRRAHDAHRPSASQRGYGRKWGRTRTAYLAGHPTCEDSAGCIETATEVHHLDGLGPNGPDGHEAANLQALCKRHHDQLTSQQQPGGWNA